MRTKITVPVLAIALIGTATAAFAQGPAGAGDAAATIPGSEVRAGEAQRMNATSGVTTGNANLPYENQRSDRPQSPVNSYSGRVTHSDEQAKGLVPGSTTADGGRVRNRN